MSRGNFISLGSSHAPSAATSDPDGSNPNPNPNPNQAGPLLPRARRAAFLRSAAACAPCGKGVGLGVPCGETSWLRPRPAGSPEAPFSARSCSRLPQASASVGQSASWAALAGHTGLVFDLGACCARARSKRRAAATARAGAGAPGQGSRLRIRVRVRFRVRIRIRIRVRVGSGLTRQKSGGANTSEERRCARVRVQAHIHGECRGQAIAHGAHIEPRAASA